MPGYAIDRGSGVPVGNGKWKNKLKRWEIMKVMIEFVSFPFTYFHHFLLLFFRIFL